MAGRLPRVGGRLPGVEDGAVNGRLFQEIIVDNFAGGGGASTGIETATGRPVALC